MLLLHLYNHHHIIIIVAVGERADDDDQHILHKNVDDCSVINLQKMTSLSAEFSTEKECHLDFMQWWCHSHHPNMIARINSVTRSTKEMQNYTGEKSILAVFEEILLKSCLEHSKLLRDKTKVTEGGGKPSSTRPGVDTVSKQLSDWIFVQKRPRNKLLCVWHD